MGKSIHLGLLQAAVARGSRLLAPLLLLSSTDCALQREDIFQPPPQFARECAPPSVSPSPFTAPQTESHENKRGEAFSPRFHRIAAAVGLLPLLQQSVVLEQAQAAKEPGAEVRLLRVQQQILARTILATLEATSLSAVVRCEQARADELADSLATSQTKSAQVATVVSIIIESATMIATGGLIIAGHEIAEGIAALVGGTLAASIAGWSLYQPGEHEFHHERNVLKEIWENPKQAQYFPVAVWRFLNEPTEEGQSLREQLVESWKSLSRIKGLTLEEENKRFTLLVGPGGIYTIGDLRSRGAMLEMLAAAIDLMHDELEVLVREMLIREETVPGWLPESNR